MRTNRQQELLKLARKELRQGQHRLGSALWFVQGKAISPEEWRNLAVIEIIKAAKHLNNAAEIFLDEHKEFHGGDRKARSYDATLKEVGTG